MEKHLVIAESAENVWNWLQTRGGIAVWNSINLSNPGASWTTPLNKEDGIPYSKPTWEAADTPERIITDPAEVMVTVDKEVKRFRVGVRMGSQGLSMKVTDGGSRRIRKELSKAGENATYRFDYETQEAVILVPEKLIPIAEFISKKAA